MDVAFAKRSSDIFLLNLEIFFATSSLLLLFVTRDKFVIMFVCLFTYLMPVPSLRGKFNDDRNLICLVHHCVPSVSLGVWQGVDP